MNSKYTILLLRGFSDWAPWQGRPDTSNDFACGPFYAISQFRVQAVLICRGGFCLCARLLVKAMVCCTRRSKGNHVMTPGKVPRLTLRVSIRDSSISTFVPPEHQSGETYLLYDLASSSMILTAIYHHGPFETYSPVGNNVNSMSHRQSAL